MGNSPEEILRDLKKLKNKEKELRSKIIIRAKETLFGCVDCKKENPIGSWIFLQIRYYVEPYSCSEGDYWASNKPEHCRITCPACGSENLIQFHPQCAKLLKLIKAVAEYAEYDLFAKVEKVKE